MPKSSRRPAWLLGWTAAAAVAALMAAACGGGGGSSGSAPPTSASSSSAPPNSAAQTGNGTSVTVDETEFRLAVSTTSFTAGAYTFTAVNQGKVAHSLEITGPGVNAQTATLTPGQSAELHVTLQAGSYDLFCPIDSHKSLGMNQEITVK
jgi:plastocyanin